MISWNPIRWATSGTPIISERGKTAKTGDSEKMDAETAFWEERGEGAAATLGKFANDWGNGILQMLSSHQSIPGGNVIPGVLFCTKKFLNRYNSTDFLRLIYPFPVIDR